LSLAELERTTILERQKIGILKAKEEGKYKGRSPIQISPLRFEKCYEKYINSNRERKYPLRVFAKELNVSKTTLVCLLKEYRKNGGSLNENRTKTKEKK